MRVAPLIRVAATLLCCLPSVTVGQVRTTVVQVTVPSVIGLSLNDALKAMSDARLRCTATRIAGGNPSAGDIVESQKPAATSRVPFTTACALVVRPQAVAQTPNVLGRSMQDANSILRVAELRPRVTFAPSPDTALGSVLRQNPSPGAPIRPDRSIDLTLAGVPQVVGRALAEAIATIERAHLRVGSTTNKELPTGKDNAVLEQSPAAGQAARPRTPVNLVVAKVIVRATVPSLVGQSLDRATQALRDARLVLGRVDVTDSPSPPNQVLQQGIPPQTIVPLGTSVDVVVAQVPTFPMPDLVGRPIAEARAIAARAQLPIASLKIANAEGRPDTVVGQTPLAGTKVRRGDTVTLVAGRAITPVVVPVPLPVPPAPTPVPTPTPGTSLSVLVPNFVGHRIDSASGLPGADSLRLFTRYAPATGNTRDSLVTAQSIQPNTRVSIGSSVELTVSQRATVRMLRLTVVPESISIASGDTVRMTAIARMSDGTQSQVVATWTASSGNIAGDGRFIAGTSMTRVIVTASQGGQSATAVIRVSTAPPWWRIVFIAAGLAGLGLIGRLAWRHFRPVQPPPPLAFTYDYELPAPETEIATSGSHGPDLALVSYAGESEHTIEPRGVTLFDEEKSYEEKSYG